MALIKRKTRKKLSKPLAKLVRRHGAEMALALVAGLISTLADDAPRPKARRVKRVEPRAIEEDAVPRTRPRAVR